MWVGGDPLIIFETTTGHDGLGLGWVWPFDGLRLLVGFGIGGFFMLSPSTMVVVRSGPLEDVEAGDSCPQGDNGDVGDHWTDVALIPLQHTPR